MTVDPERLLPMPPNRDYDGAMLGNGWVRVTGEATCGCHWELSLKQSNDRNRNLTFRECFDLYGAQFMIGVHDAYHVQACLEALPPGAMSANVWFDSDMTLGELLEAT